MSDPAQIKAALAEGVDAGLLEAVQLFEVKSNEVAPYEKGDLVRSSVSGMLGPGRAGVGYRDRGAVSAHERLDVPPAGGKQRKYLEHTLQAYRDEAADLLASRVRAALGT